jgi:hypothetical protein
MGGPTGMARPKWPRACGSLEDFASPAFADFAFVADRRTGVQRVNDHASIGECSRANFADLLVVAR